MKRSPLLMKDHKRIRLEFARQSKNRDWSKVNLLGGRVGLGYTVPLTFFRWFGVMRKRLISMAVPNSICMIWGIKIEFSPDAILVVKTLWSGPHSVHLESSDWCLWTTEWIPLITGTSFKHACVRFTVNTKKERCFWFGTSLIKPAQNLCYFNSFCPKLSCFTVLGYGQQFLINFKRIR